MYVQLNTVCLRQVPILGLPVRLYPTISLTGSAGFASADLGDLFKSGSFAWSIGPSLDIPIFDWGTRQPIFVFLKQISKLRCQIMKNPFRLHSVK